MKRLIRKADADKKLTIDLCEYVNQLIERDLEPEILDLESNGIYYLGYDGVIDKFNSIINEYEFISKKAQEMKKPNDISGSCFSAKQLINKTKTKLQGWNEDLKSLPDETEADIEELSRMEYDGDLMVTECLKELAYHNYEIKGEVNDMLKELQDENMDVFAD